MKEGVTFHPVSQMDEVLAIAFPDDRTSVMTETEYMEYLASQKKESETQEADRNSNLASALRAVLTQEN